MNRRKGIGKYGKTCRTVGEVAGQAAEQKDKEKEKAAPPSWESEKQEGQLEKGLTKG